MWPYFSTDYSGNSFTLFSSSHWLAIVVLLGLYIGLFLSRNFFRESPAADRTARYTIAGILLVQETVLNIWRLVNGDWSVTTSLPLHICGVAVLLSAVLMFNRRYSLFEVTFFWGLGGALQALITPDIGQYGFPHFRYFHFFVSHGTLILASLYMIFVYQYRPQHKSIWKIYLLTNVYAAVIGVFNWFAGANYLYICRKPETGSLLDVLGPWPWYLIAMELLLLVSFYLYYSPFAIQGKIASEH